MKETSKHKINMPWLNVTACPGSYVGIKGKVKAVLRRRGGSEG